MLKKNLLTIIIILLTILMIVMVVWTYNNKIKSIKDEMQPGISFISKQIQSFYY